MVRYLFILLWLVAAAAPAFAQSGDRVALVIGNAAYEHTNPLRNPVNDANAVAETFEGLGYDVTKVTDANQAEMLRALYAFTRRARNADTAVIFYSGHGMELGRDNYLIPVQARLEDEWSGRQESVSLRSLRDAVALANRLAVVIIDACRDNRFPSSARGSKGMGPVENRPGEIIAFATQPGMVAQDGDGPLSPFTEALVERLRVSPEQDARILFSSLRLSVRGQHPSVELGRLPQTVISLANQNNSTHEIPQTANQLQASGRTQPLQIVSRSQVEVNTIPLPPVLRPSIPACQGPYTHTIYFKPNQLNLTTDINNIIDQIVRMIETYCDPSILVTGHVVYSGTRTYNQRLAEKRVAIVADALVAADVDARRINVSISTESTSNLNIGDNVRADQNRRVTISISER